MLLSCLGPFGFSSPTRLFNIVLFLFHILLLSSFGVHSQLYPPFGSSNYRYPSSSPYSDCPLPFSGPGYSAYSTSFYGKPSYAYSSPYTGYGGLSGYEGPPYGLNTYWQPGVAYAPYGVYSGSGYYGPSSSPAYSPFGVGSALGSACRDHSSDCALLASSGQCGPGGSARSLCPQSCGLGCPVSPYSPFSPAGPSPYSPFAPPASLGTNLPLPSTGTFGPTVDPTFGPGLGTSPGLVGGVVGPPFACRDSHIFGCPQWASQGLCQQVPEYMFNYCRASCGVCSGPGSSGILPTPGLGGSSAAGIGGFGPDFTSTVGPLAPGGFPSPSTSGLTPTDPFGVGAGIGDPFGTASGGGVFPPTPLSAFSSPSSLSSSFYSPYSPFFSPFRSTSLAALNEHKEKQQKGAKVLFSEDEFNLQNSDNELWTAGLHPSASSSFSSGFASSPFLSSPSSSSSSSSIFDQSPSQVSALFNNAGSSLNWPPSSLTTQHSSLSKMVRMDDLALDKAKQRKKSRL